MIMFKIGLRGRSSVIINVITKMIYRCNQMQVFLNIPYHVHSKYCITYRVVKDT